MACDKSWEKDVNYCNKKFIEYHIHDNNKSRMFTRLTSGLLCVTKIWCIKHGTIT